MDCLSAFIWICQFRLCLEEKLITAVAAPVCFELHLAPLSKEHLFICYFLPMILFGVAILPNIM